MSKRRWNASWSSDNTGGSRVSMVAKASWRSWKMRGCGGSGWGRLLSIFACSARACSSNDLRRCSGGRGKVGGGGVMVVLRKRHVGAKGEQEREPGPVAPEVVAADAGGHNVAAPLPALGSGKEMLARGAQAVGVAEGLGQRHRAAAIEATSLLRAEAEG